MVVAAMVTDPRGRCSRQYAPSVAKTQKYHSSHVRADRYIAAIAIVKTGKISSNN
jgi:hypothetical protein